MKYNDREIATITVTSVGEIDVAVRYCRSTNSNNNPSIGVSIQATISAASVSIENDINGTNMQLWLVNHLYQTDIS